MSELAGKRILLGITGGVAAYKSALLVRSLVTAGADVQVVMTDAAARFVTPVTFQALSGKPVFTDMWDARIPNNMGHIELSRDRELIVVAPATANFMAKVVHGLADDLLSTLALARDCPLMLAPGDEPPDVGEPGHAAQRAHAGRRRHHAGRPRRGRPGVRRDGDGPHARTRADPRADRARTGAEVARRQARRGDGRADVRAHRYRARHDQPFQRQDGLRGGAGRGRSRRRRHARCGHRLADDARPA